MGKLRSNLDGLTQLVGAVQKRCEAAAQQSDNFATNGQYAFDLIVAGMETLSLYLREKVSKAGKPWDAVKDTPIFSDKDTNVVSFVKGIQDGRQRATKLLAEWTQFCTRELGGMDGDLTRVDALIADLRGVIGKKRKRLLQSKKFKDKIAGYEASLNGIEAAVANIRNSIKRFKQVEYSERALNTLKIATTSTYGDVDDMAGRQLATLKENIKKEMEHGVYQGKQWRQQHFGSELAMLAKMAAEAEEMEQEPDESEGTETTAPKTAPATRAIKNLEVRIKTTLVAKAPTAEFTTATATLVADLKWEKSAGDPLDYLQKKFTLKGAYSDDGVSFASDMKLVKLGGNLKTATFKGLAAGKSESRYGACSAWTAEKGVPSSIWLSHCR